MIIFWILTLFIGASAFSFALIFLQLGIGWSLVYAVVAMLRRTRGLFKAWVRFEQQARKLPVLVMLAGVGVSVVVTTTCSTIGALPPKSPAISITVICNGTEGQGTVVVNESTGPNL